MSETKTGRVVDGDIRRTGALRNIKQDKVETPQNAPRPVGPKPKQ